MNPLSLEGRWSEDIESILGDYGTILASQVNNDYQGDCKYLIDLGDRYAIAEWSWGSCNYCDPYEDMSSEERRKELASCITYVDTKEKLLAYIENIESVFLANTPVMYHKSERPWILAARETLLALKKES
jgi:hypothetical protein